MGTHGPGPRSGMDPKVLLGKLPEQELTEVDRPDAVGALFEPDVLVLKRSTHEELPPVDANGPRGTDHAPEVMASILGGGQRTRIRSSRRLPPPRPGLVSQRLVRTVIVISLVEPVDLTLLPN